jgi:hypothetical protein
MAAALVTPIVHEVSADEHGHLARLHLSGLRIL